MASSSPSIASSDLAGRPGMRSGESLELDSLLLEVRSTTSAGSHQTATLSRSSSPQETFGQANTDSAPAHQDSDTTRSPVTARTPFWRLWATEIVSMIMSLCLLAAIVAILAAFDGVPQPDWGIGVSLTLNSLIAIISTVCRALLMLVGGEVLSYLKWRWFHDTRPLSDLETIHRASLGLWGSSCLLFSRIRHVLITISALLVILLAAFGPFTQQAIRSFVCRVQVLPNNQASIPIAHYLNSTDVASVICDEDGCTLDLTLGISMKSAILGAMTAKEDGTNKLEFTCPTGDCEFKAGPTDSAYTSIGLCNECFDITSLVREWPGQDDTDMQRAQLNLTLEGMMTAQTSISSPYWLSSITSDDFVWLDNELGNFTQNITYLTYTWAPCTTNQTHPVFGGEEDSASEWFDNWICPISSYPSIPHMREDLAVLAVNCTFYPCMRSYVARVETGILRETPVSQVRMTHAVNEAVPISDPRVLIEPCFVEGQPYSHFNISLVPNMAGRNLTTVWTPQGELEAPVECVYRISYATIRSLSHYFQTELFGNTHCGWVAYYDSHNLGWITCPSEAWWLESLYNRGFATFESVNSLVQNISLAVSNQMRAKGTNANWTAPEFATGTMWNSTVCTRVDWAWMALPASLELITLVLLVTVITMSLRDHGKHPIWKSSTLPLVFHGLRDIKDASGNSEPPLSGATSPTPFPIDLAGMEKISKDLAVRLSTELGSSGFVVDQTSIHRRKSDTRHEAAP